MENLKELRIEMWKEKIEQTFSLDRRFLPGKEEVDVFCRNRLMDVGLQNFRTKYCKQSFTVLTHEFMKDMAKVIRRFDFEDIVELSCGPGWLSYWLDKYGIKVNHSIDNKSWQGHEYYLDIVEQQDSIEFVKAHQEVELFILSWPYMDEIATKIWKEMRKGQYLLYIGEYKGGCTADDEFFRLIWNSESMRFSEMLQKHFIQFDGIYDLPRIYVK